jgi:ABC-type lipoprotein export system ATPase subunit
MALLEGRNLRKTYKLSRRNEVLALRGVTVSIEAGELVALMGPSGSGKSTLMHLLGLLHSPDQDHGPAPVLSFGGRDATRMSDGERTRIRAREMGFVFQQFNLVPTLTAVENVMLAGEYAWPSARRTARPSCPAASSNAWRSPGRSSTTRRSSWPTSRPATSTHAGPRSSSA